MGDISQKEKQKMQATANFDYQSLAEVLNQQLANAIGQQQSAQKASARVQSMAPEVEKDVESMRDLSQRVEGQRPSEMLGAASSLGEAFTRQAASAADAAGMDNILSVLTQMITLKNQEQQAEQDILNAEYTKEQTKALKLENQAALAERGMVWDEQLGGPRAMTEEEEAAWANVKYSTLSDEDAIGLLKEITGLNELALGGTVSERGSYARRLLNKIDKGEGISYKNVLPQEEKVKVDKLVDTVKEIDKALNAIESSGKQTGFFPNLLLSVGGPFDLITKSSAELQTALANIAGLNAFENAGKQLTSTEREIVEGKINIMKKGEKQNKAILESIKRKAIQEINDLAGNLAPNLEEQTENIIRVREKSSGRTGTIEADEFNPELYEKI